jgi:tetratricopeptide (TPR) repeat protein
VATDTETVGETSSVVDLKRVEILLDLRRYDEALTEANRCAATSPGDPRPLLLVARAELGLGHPKRAQQAAETAIGFAPDSAAAFRLQAIALTVQARQLGRPGSRPRSYLSERALQAARQSIALEPEEPAGYWAFTDAAVVDRRLREAIAASGDAVRLAPDHPTSWLMRARVARHARDVRAAEAACREALRLDPQHYPGWTVPDAVPLDGRARPDVVRRAAEPEAAGGLDPVVRHAGAAGAARTVRRTVGPRRGGRHRGRARLATLPAPV